MAGVPITFRGMMYPKDKTVKPYPFTALGVAEITGLSVGGGPILPPDVPIEPPIEPPLTIWPNPPEGVAPHPEHPIVLPDPIKPPEHPPASPEKPHPGWNWKPSTPNSPQAGWYFLYVPGAGAPQPKK